MTIPFDPDAVARSFGEEPDIPDAPVAGALNAPTAADFLAEQIADPRWLCADIVPEGAIGYIGGPPKVFKSFAALDLAMAVASGGAFCGRFLCPEPRRVLIVQFESSRAHFQKRVRAIVSRYGDPPPNLHIVSNEPVVFEDPVAVGRLTRTIEQVRPDLMILDPLSAMTSGDENSAQEMGAVVRQVRAWRDAYGCAIAVVHHTNKAAARAGEPPRSGMRLRGSSVFYAAAEFALWIDRPDDDAPRIEVRVEQKEAEPRRPFAAEFREVGAELVVVQDEITRQVTDNDLVDAIWNMRTHRATNQELQAALDGVPDRTLRRRLGELVAQRRIYVEQGSGRGAKPTVYVVTSPRAAAPRLITGDDA